MSATFRMYANGLSMGVAGRNPTPAKRGTITGWSPGAVRRHTRWLYSIDAPQLQAAGEHGYAVTLTVRYCPASEDEWREAVRRFQRWCREHGATRLHWVVEWQRRGVPHLHCAVYFPPLSPENGMTAAFAWMQAAELFEPSLNGQHWDSISGPLGWLKYLSKHASRGVRHYQRTGRPEGWEKTGRLWGHNGDWPEVPPLEFDGTMQDFHRFRRLIRSWRVADARSAGDRDRIGYARRMLACPQKRLSAVRGVSDWVPEDVALRLLDVVLGRRLQVPYAS